MTGLADRSLRDVVPMIDRYRPVALTVTAILVAIVVLPGATRGPDAASPASFDSPRPGEVADGRPDDAADDLGSEEGSAAPGDGPAIESPSFSPPAPSFGAPGDAASTDGDTSAPPAPSVEPPGSPEPDPDRAEPITIVEFAWASSTGGTPVPHDIPDDSLPVGTLIGQPDKASYLRLAGDDSRLVLTEVAEGRRGNSFETSPVQACQILRPGWEPGQNLSFDEAPAHDPDDCVTVVPQPDGTWTVDLTPFASPTDGRGLALVPGPDAPIDFQVTFSSVTAG